MKNSEPTLVKAEPYRECPRFKTCSVNNCPLHQQYPNLLSDPEDPDQRCKMEKGVRVRIGAQYSKILKFQGLTTREYGAKIRWESLSPEEQQERIAKAKLLHLTRSVKNEISSAGVGEGTPA